MQRLILEFSTGDGYTYSAEVTVPIIYESKEKAIEDFELLLLQKNDDLEQLNRQKEKNYQQLQKISYKVKKIQDNNNLSSKEEIECNNLNDYFKNTIYPLEQKITDLHTIHFGGQQLNLSDFTYYSERTKKIEYSTPTIITLDEYYEQLENPNKNTNKNTNKNKM